MALPQQYRIFHLCKQLYPSIVLSDMKAVLEPVDPNKDAQSVELVRKIRRCLYGDSKLNIINKNLF